MSKLTKCIHNDELFYFRLSEDLIHYVVSILKVKECL